MKRGDKRSDSDQPAGKTDSTRMSLSEKRKVKCIVGTGKQRG